MNEHEDITLLTAAHFSVARRPITAQRNVNEDVRDVDYSDHLLQRLDLNTMKKLVCSCGVFHA